MSLAIYVGLQWEWMSWAIFRGSAVGVDVMGNILGLAYRRGICEEQSNPNGQSAETVLRPWHLGAYNTRGEQTIWHYYIRDSGAFLP